MRQQLKFVCSALIAFICNLPCQAQDWANLDRFQAENQLIMDAKKGEQLYT